MLKFINLLSRKNKQFCNIYTIYHKNETSTLILAGIVKNTKGLPLFLGMTPV